MKSMVIGISGGTGSGKTTLSNTVIESIGSDKVIYMQQDSYYRNLADMPLDSRHQANFDHPDAFDSDLMLAHLKALCEGKGILKPVYDYASHTRLPDAVCVDPLPVIIVEGILVFVDARMRKWMDLKIFLDCDADIRLMRRLRRDLLERGRSAESVLQQYETTVRPMHLKYVETTKRHADMVLSGSGSNEAGVAMIVGRIRSFLSAIP
jgi:uridine kinase